jgi:hypothetical protein
VTVADRLEAFIVDHGPRPGGTLAIELGIRKSTAFAELHGNPDRFVHHGKRRASRWDVRGPSFTPADAAEHWGEWGCRPEDPPCTLQLAESFLAGFEKLGYVERVNGNGRFRVTERGREAGAAVEALA